MEKTGENDPYPMQPQVRDGPPPYTAPLPVPVPPTVTQPGQGQAAVTVTQPPPVPLGPVPAHMTCPSCGARITTRVQHVTAMKTHVMCLIMFSFLLWPCCFIPYFMDTCKNATHYCPSCDSYLGEYNSK